MRRVTLRLMTKIAPNSRVVSKLSPMGGQRTFYSFIGIKGLELDCAPNGTALGNRRWRVRYYVAGKQTASVIGSFNEDDRESFLTLSQATERAAELRREVKVERKDPRQSGLTLADLFQRWLEGHAKAKKRSWPEDEARFRNHVNDRIGEVLLSDLERQHIAGVLDATAKKAGPIASNRTRATLNAALRWGLNEGLLTSHPGAGLAPRGAERKRARPLSDDELRRVWQGLNALSTAQRRALQLVILTGLRRSEIGGLPVAEVNGTTLRIHHTRRKGWRIGKPEVPHVVPLPPLAASILKGALVEARGGWVFPSRTKAKATAMSDAHLSKAFQRVATDAGVKDVVLHDVRHTVKTGLMALGVSPHIANKIMDHGDHTIGGVYDHFGYEAEKLEALQKWQVRLLEIVSPSPRGAATKAPIST